jgi:3-hydroxyisobutyrate dehydrogenase
MPSTVRAEDGGMPSVTYGFVGIGRMGFPMALHFRAKMPAGSKLVVCDVNESRVKEFLQQAKYLGPVDVASCPKEVAEQCVSGLPIHIKKRTAMPIYPV